MPRTADDSNGKLSETNITDFSSIIAHNISVNYWEFNDERNI